ncbi:MAG: hypothetical protein Q3982_05475 [Phoenicibacter congonensis]|uniref:Uncharacterized protein n=1 Tax=Phoenicibacter congonensis TaxID=1944646 RepID=A0AA43RHW0_9ACTN|nr:hypothetical protein [Phoenicibacter congonensis]
MSEYVPINYAAMDISIGQRTSAYSKVVLVNADGKEFSSGTDDGMTLTIDMPWASQEMADSLLPKFAGRWYQSYTAQDSFVSPDADLGEAVKIAGVKGSILSRRTEFGRQMSSTISAPGEEELDHEYEYITKVDREAQRQRSVFGNALAKVAKDANDKILENYNDLVAALNGDDGAPEDLKAGIANYVRYDLENNEGFAATKLFAQIGEKAKAEITAYVIKDKDGHAKSFLELMADVIKLQGDVEILGNFTVEGGSIKLINGKGMWIPDSTISVGGGSRLSPSTITYLTSVYHYTTGLSVGGDGITMEQKVFKPSEITSTDGKEHTVLGCA